MRGISAKSLVEVLAAVDAAKGDTEKLGDELFRVVGVLDVSPRLRRILADPAIETEAQDGLARTVFGDKIGAPALDVVAVAAGSRWSSGRDMTDALETAGVAAHVSAADTAGKLDTLETELFEIGRTIASDPELRQTISDRGIPVDARAALLTDLLGDHVTSSALALATQAAAARTGSFEKSLAAFGEIAASRRGRVLANVRVAYELGKDEKTRLASALAAKYGRDVHLNIIVDPSVIGGIAVSVGGEVVDGTMSTRLEVAGRRLAG